MSEIVPLSLDDPRWSDMLGRLAYRARVVDLQTQWPAESLADLAAAGVLSWIVPGEYGGQGWLPADVTRGYVDLASACLTTTFILTQCNAAIQRIAESPNEALKRELLPRLARGEEWATVGISHLTTSRQHLSRPVVEVASVRDGYCVRGEIPWVTGGLQANYIVTGGIQTDGLQLLLVVSTASAGVRCETPARLLALSASSTGRVGLSEVIVPTSRLVSGPAVAVMRSSSGGTGSLGTSALATGLAQRAIELLESEGAQRADIAEIARRLRTEWTQLFEDLLRAAAGLTAPMLSSESLRGRANALALRSTQAALTATKGAGFVSGHPAERMVREAMFFLVWSCPQPVAAAALREFACLVD
ncbi:MAG: acyl-CoA dehydrogenase family protein [Planctomycetaceae bacterium]